MLNLSLISGNPDRATISDILLDFHSEGPVDSNHLETLSYLKKFSPEFFKEFEPRIMFLMGLFYKAGTANSFIEKIYEIYSEAIQEETGRLFTPVQADAYKAIGTLENFSFSAPTSAGKSFLYQEIIKDIDGDIVIVVPSRALLSEYILKVRNLVGNEVLVLPFIELVNTAKTSKRIYIITPERGDELFKFEGSLDIKLFLFDEAQLSEEGIRGMKFDSFVRRVDKHFGAAKKVFTHPFVVNPEAQLKKHNLLKSSDSATYNQKAVGKIYLEHRDGNFKFFSPFADSSKGKISYDGDIIEDTLANSRTALIYISKQKIYSGEFIELYSKYLKLCSNVTDPRAVAHIDELAEYIGENREQRSLMIRLMRLGIVIHHGSMPLKARLIVERFVNEGFAKLCFSTSTLIQGINMPFDLVWINNFKFNGNSDDQKRLNLKNLIGRAGRSTNLKNQFDYGYVVIEASNKATFISRINEESRISEISLLDQSTDKVEEDYKDIVNAIKEDTFNTEMNLTETQVQRINDADLDTEIKYILDNLLNDKNVPITGNAYYNLGIKRQRVKAAFQVIYTSHLRRRVLSIGEQSVLSAAIPILLWQIQGKSFAEVVSLRYSFLSQRDFRRKLRRDFRNGKISATKLDDILNSTKVKFSAIAESLPKKSLVRAQPLFRSTSIKDVEYDILIYDTYDYIDKVISLSLKDPLAAAFLIYYSKHRDVRALAMSNYIKYGTNNATEIWLLKYGFTFDEIEWILPHVQSINEQQIIFSDTLQDELEDDRKREVVTRYL